MAITSTDKKDMDTIMRMVEQKSDLDQYYNAFTDERLVELLKKLKKINYRVFMGTNNFGQTMVSTQEYIKQMGYNDSITNDGSELKLCVISDLHLGSINDDPGYVDRVWEFCAKNGIHHILNLGDLAEGSEYLCDGCRKKENYKSEITRTLESQVNYLNKYVPFDKNITHHVLYGNHDLYSSDGVSIDLSKAMNEAYGRKDLMICGIEDTKFKINNDYIHLIHHSFPDMIKPYLNKLEGAQENEFILAGHSHISKTYSGHSYNLECIPTLSKDDHHLDGFVFYSGFVVLTINFNSELKMQHIRVDKYKINDYHSDFETFSPHEIAVRRLKKH